MTEQAAPRTRTYQSGDWYGVVGPDVLVLLPPEEKHRVATIWALADSGAGFDETLDALISGGLRDLHGFVLVSASEGDTKVVIRGAARAEFTAGGESVVLEGSSATTWVERSLSDVQSMALVVGEAPAGAPSYVMELGLVRVSRLTEGLDPGAEPAAAPHVAAAAAPAAVPEDGDDADEPAVHASDPVEVPSAPQGLAGPGAFGLVAVPAGADFDSDDDSDTADADAGSAAPDGSELEPEPDVVEPVEPTDTTDGDGPLAVGEDAEAVDDPMVDPQEEPAVEPEAPGGTDVDPWIDPSSDPAPLADSGSFESSFDLVPEEEPPAPAGDDVPEPPAEECGAAAEVTEVAGEPDPADEMETGVMPVVPDDGPAEPSPDVQPQLDLPETEPDLPEPDLVGSGSGSDAVEGRPVLDLGPTEAFDPAELEADDQPDRPLAPGVLDAPVPPGDSTWVPDHDGATTMQPSDPLPPVEDDPAGWAVDHDGATSMAPFESEEYELARPGIAGQPPAPPLTTRPVARLAVSTGETIDVDRIVVLGRAPMARRYGPDEHPMLVTVPSPHQEISSTHVEVRPGAGADHGTAVVTDLGSTNGTVVTQPGLDPDELQPGISVQLIPGAVIDLGDGVTITVARP